MNTKNALHSIFIVVFSLSAFIAKSASVELSIQLLVPDALGERQLETDSFFQWVKNINTAYESALKDVKGNHEGILLISLDDEESVEFKVSFKPPVSDEVRSGVLRQVKNVGQFHTTVGKYSFFVRAKVNKGSTRKGDNYYPPVVFPREERLTKLQTSPLATQTTSLKQYVDQDIIPVLQAFELAVDPQFQGVRKVGEILQSGEFKGVFVADFLDTNTMYWRALLEMTKGNQLIVLSRVCMHLSNEEWDVAENYLDILGLFSTKNSVADYYASELRDLLKVLKENLNREIMKGIKMYDEGDLEASARQYYALSLQAPKSAFLNYEMYLTEVSGLKQGDSFPKIKTREIWDKHRPNIYRSNPMYSSMAQASSADEAYELVCRSMVGDLFKEKGQTKRDMLRYADLAIELEDYAFAAHMYWWLFNYLGNDGYEEREMLSEFLYALHKLGNSEIRKNFKGDFDAEFRKIDARRKGIKEADTMYQAFKK